MRPPVRGTLLRVLAEGLVIVASILLAFGIDAWWDGRQERRDERIVLAGLAADFAANRAALEETVHTHETVLLYRLARLPELTAAEVAGMPSDSAELYTLAVTGIWTFDAQDGTLDALIASGRLGVLRDPLLRGMLLEWKAKVDDLSEEADQFRTTGLGVADRVAAIGGPWARRRHAALGVTPALVDALGRFPDPDLARVVNDAELMGRLRAKRWRSIVYIAELVPLVEHAETVLALLEGDKG